jgi:hypothetical protein
VFERLYIHDIADQACLKLFGLWDYWVLDSLFVNCSPDEGGIVQHGTHRGLVERNEIRDTGGSPIEI